MNYLKIKNHFELVKYKFPDVFTVNIYYINDSECNISVKREDSGDGWGLSLEIKIYDLYYPTNFHHIIFGSSEENFINKKFKISVLLEQIELKYNNIPTYLAPRNYHNIENKYQIINNDISNNDFIDFHLVIYHLDNNLCYIIVRRLDETCGWEKNIRLVLYDIDNKTKEYFNIGSSNENFKFLEKKTKIPLHIKKNDYKQNIPKIILQTGKDIYFKNLYHYNSILTFIELNPEYHYIYYDNAGARKFLRQNFSDEINYAYDILIPGAFKADLLRYCLLYHYGGCYFDCKQILKISIRDFLESNKKFIICNDVIENALLNAIILSVPKSTIIYKTIQDCVYNIINKIKISALGITGPLFFFKSICEFINSDNLILQNFRPKDNFEDFVKDYYNNNVKLMKDGNPEKIILNRFYKTYYDNYIDTDHYGKLFEKNEIFYENYQKIENIIILFYPFFSNNNITCQIKDNKLIIMSKNILNQDLKMNIINNNTYKEKCVYIEKSNNNFAIVELYEIY